MSRFILFDLDGTLIDGVDDLVNALNLVLQGHGLAAITRRELEPMLGDGMRMLTMRAFKSRQVMLSDENLDRASKEFLINYKATNYSATRLFSGVSDTLHRLHAEGWHIGLASNKFTEPCGGILQRLGVYELFSVVAGGDATHVKKPDRGHLLFALQQMGFDRTLGHRAVMVGDHANDVDAARGADITAIAVALEVSAARANSLGADAVITDFATLPATLRALSF